MRSYGHTVLQLPIFHTRRVRLPVSPATLPEYVIATFDLSPP
ncbi:hypothetical protein SAMCCGM7_pC2157 (plasmid) [Sinorhizobium americanum CCGM7]|nr:hypothetical protein SAMCCGM7_pC2157 [Sinorhizobium americanum CCGM7]